MKTVFAFLLLPAVAWAQAHDLPVSDTIFAMYDLEALKPGDWILRETVITMTGEDGEVVSYGWRSRIACVRKDKARVWIEQTVTDLNGVDPERVMLDQVLLKTGRIESCWEKEGEKEIRERKVRVEPEHEEEPDLVPLRNPKLTKEAVTVGKRELKCDKVEAELPLGGKVESWFSAEVPFRLRLGDPRVRRRYLETQEADLNPRSQALIRSVKPGEKEGDTRKVTLLDWGTDAKPTLEVK